MAEDGIGKGDLVAISLGSRTEYFETFFACTRLGAALVLLNYAYTESEMLALLKQVRESTPIDLVRFICSLSDHCTNDNLSIQNRR